MDKNSSTYKILFYKVTNWIEKKFSNTDSKREFTLQGLVYYKWYSMPIVRLLLPFLIGIISESFFDVDLTSAIYMLSTVFVFYLCWIFIKKTSQSYSYSFITGVFLFLFLIVYGNVSVNLKRNILSPNHFNSLLIDTNAKALIKIYEPPTELQNSYRTKAVVVQVFQNKYSYKTSGNLLLYFEKSKAIENIKYGSELLIYFNPQKTDSPKNPFEFNYKKYLENNDIYFSQRLNSNQWLKWSNGNSNLLMNWSYFLKTKIFEVYKKYIPNKTQSGVAAALIFGYREELDKDLVNAYAHTGTLHVLAVSGLHVGIVYTVLTFLLSFMNKKRNLLMLKTVIVIILLWFYAMLTGFSPSVLRAALMFSFISIGIGLNRNINIYNSIAASAFILLVNNPLLVYDVGFQLSYCAVLGIIFLHPKLYQFYQPKYWILDQIWNISCVSIAAQAATCPFSFYYFHQFPNYFLLSNLLIIPLSTLITYLGLILLAVSSIPILAQACGWLLNATIYLTDELVYTIDKIPYSTTNDLVISLPQAILIACLILFSAFIIVYKNKNWIWAVLFTLIMLTFSKSIEDIRHQEQQEVWIYHWPKNTTFSFLNGKESIVISDSSCFNFNKLFDLKIKPHLMNSYIDKIRVMKSNSVIQNKNIKSSNNLYIFNKVYLFRIDTKNIPTISKPIDCVLVSCSPKIFLKEIVNKINCKQIVIDGNNKLWLIKRWKNELKNLSIPVHFTYEEGAYMINAN
jgi:competence protein ComEC